MNVISIVARPTHWLTLTAYDIALRVWPHILLETRITSYYLAHFLCRPWRPGTQRVVSPLRSLNQSLLSIIYSHNRVYMIGGVVLQGKERTIISKTFCTCEKYLLITLSNFDQLPLCSYRPLYAACFSESWPLKILHLPKNCTYMYFQISNFLCCIFDWWEFWRESQVTITTIL